MSPFFSNTFKFRHWDAVGTIVQLINSWSPSPLSSEKEYEQGLYNFLRSQLEGVKLVTQYGIGRSKLDIVADGSVGLELKYNITHTSELQRLLGQMLY